MIPADLRQYLDQSDRHWTLDEGEIRELTLYAADRVPLKQFEVSSYELYLSGLLSADPDETRAYDGYDLIEACNDYDSEGVLAWFPALGEYGSWDCDHHRIITYPKVTWADIAAKPTWFVNGQWYPENVPHRETNPWSDGSDD
jgi:hypothetical protein